MSLFLRRWLSVGIFAFGFNVFSYATSQAAVVDFNTPGDLSTSKFFPAVSSGSITDNYAEVPGIGVGGSRGIDTVGTTNNYTTLIYNQESFALANIGDSIIVSAFAKRRDDTNFANDSSSYLRVGITDGSNSDANRITGGSGNAMALDVFYNVGAPATDVVLRYTNKVGTNSFAPVAGGTSTLTSTNWYKLTGVFTKVDATTISISGTLENFGTDGTSTPTIVRTIAAQNFSNSGLAADTTIWGAVLARQDGGSDVLDNFEVVGVSAIPEPTTIGFLAVSLCGMLIYRRRAS